VSALARVRDVLLAEGGLLADAVVADDALAAPDPAGNPAGGSDATRWAELAASGPRVRDRAPDIAFAVAAVHEGYLLHYGRPTIVDPGGDADLALLAGDRLYALGLDRLAAVGDVAAVAELAGVIARCAEAHAGGDGDGAAAAWEAGALAIGWGREGHTDSRPRDRV
jgi:hypothetical protein